MAKCHNARVSSGLLYFTEALYRPQVNRVLLNHTVLQSFQLLANMALKIFQKDSVGRLAGMRICNFHERTFTWLTHWHKVWIYSKLVGMFYEYASIVFLSSIINHDGLQPTITVMIKWFHEYFLGELMNHKAFKKLWIARKAQVMSSASLDQPKVQNTLHLLS